MWICKFDSIYARLYWDVNAPLSSVVVTSMSYSWCSNDLPWTDDKGTPHAMYIKLSAFSQYTTLIRYYGSHIQKVLIFSASHELKCCRTWIFRKTQYYRIPMRRQFVVLMVVEWLTKFWDWYQTFRFVYFFVLYMYILISLGSSTLIVLAILLMQVLFPAIYIIPVALSDFICASVSCCAEFPHNT